ncbi:MAG: amidohydrolase [Actinobacteria bacterium]|nr:amidohydrolase [Actinomycetota bacterium]
MSAEALIEEHGPSRELRDQARGLRDAAVTLRRSLHEHPEVGNDLPVTREQVLQALDGLPLDITLHKTTSGIAALLTGDKPGPTVLLRGDMDALPMPEDTGLEFASKNANVMHACGHDTHTSMLVQTAHLLSDRRGEIPGRVLFMFQPGEEGFHGAQYMLEEGLVDLPPHRDGSESPITGAFALHISTALPVGMVGIKGGPIMASSDRMTITVTGAGGHASEPHRTGDPVPVACEIVQALQTMVTRRIDAFDPAIVTVTKINAGTAYNVIPETAVLEGTIRAVSARTRSKVHEMIAQVASGIAAAHGMSAEVDIPLGYPVTVNDPGFAGFSSGVATSILGDRKVVQLSHPVMGAEDFSYVLERLPGAMMFLGGTPADKNPATAAPNHSNRVMFDEDAMEIGVSLYAAMALRHLGVRLS